MPLSDANEPQLPARRIDRRVVHVQVPPEKAFAPIARIGGATGWYCADALWRARGWIDRLVGGPGMTRGRRDPERLSVGDTVDFWRVEICEPGRRLRLVAEMRVPGRAWLEFETIPHQTGTEIRQTATFDPIGLAGLLYWYSLVPFHGFIFGGMLREIARRASAPSS
jgi:hypothetical protein